jgi:uncharacterized sporulation protein YeaH/YhbH (DUF444 family)
MSYIVDRRLNSKNKSTVNRERFLRRYRGHIKKAVSEAIDKRSITDLDSGEKISIPSKDVSEPHFSHGDGGRRDKVLPGNEEFVSGDKIKRPQGGGGSGGSGSGAGDSGDGDDEFVFQITQEEFLNFMFDDLALPNLVKRQLAGDEDFTYRRAGISNEGNPGRVNIVRTLRSANARRIALTGAKRKELRALEERLEAISPAKNDIEMTEAISLQADIDALRKRIKRVPWLDNFDVKYNLHVRLPVPRSRAVMFCIMDVSGSMDQATKDVAKRFFLLLYLFLKRNYDKTEVVFIRHHTSAKEVDEQEFFYSRETGGTIVSSALRMMGDIIRDRYPPSQWNIYGAQASDGDNWNDDSSQCYKLLTDEIMPAVQYFSYLEITPRDHQALWHSYEKVHQAFPDAFAMRQLVSAADIFPIFRELFQKKAA